MRACRSWLLPILLVTGCFEKPPNVPFQFQVGGEVAGMWDGGAVTLRLSATGVDELLTVQANEPFTFETVLDDESSFTITIETAPLAHDCTVIDGAGALAGADYDVARVDCDGPPVDVALSAPVDWQFDPELLAQDVDVSLLAQELSVTVTAADATAIRVQDAAVASGAPSAPITLALGANAITIDVEVETMSRTFELTLDRSAAQVEQYVYGKASNTGADDQLGYSIAASGDTIVVGAPFEDSGSNGINGPQDSESAADSGAVYVFRRTGTTWEQEAYIKASNTDEGDRFGTSVAIDGNTLVVGATHEDGPANAVADAGAAYVFVRDGNLWTQQAYLRASDAVSGDAGGASVTVSGDTLAFGTLDDGVGAGYVVVFTRTASKWSEEDRVQASAGGSLGFGAAVALLGEVLAVGAPSLGTQQAYVFRRNGTQWVEEQIIAPPSESIIDAFGLAIDIGPDMIVVGARGESSSGRGINPPDADEDSPFSGAVYVFRRSGGSWAQTAFLKSSNSDANDGFGKDVAISGDLLAVGAWTEASADPGVDGDQSDNTAASAGAAYLFRWDGSTWTQEHYLKASNPGMNDQFSSVALSVDGLVVGALGEDSDSRGLGGSQGDGVATGKSGAFYVFR